MEVVGGAFLSAALNVLFDRITPKFLDLFRGRKEIGLLLGNLETTLLTIHAVLDDAEDKQISNPAVKKWLFGVKNTVDDAEDLVDEVNTEALRLQLEAGEQSMTDTVSHLSDKFLKEIIPKIEDVVTALAHFESKILALGLERHRVMKQDDLSRWESTSLVDESAVYGRDTERKMLIDMVLDGKNGNGNNFSVIPIVGMGGLGKTTLAQLVYNDESVKKHFDKRAWVWVSGNYDAFQITQTLVQKVSGGGLGEKDDLDMLQVKLNESLRDKKFLIVLDDIWNRNGNDWDKLKAPFKDGRQGSIILVTTRDEIVAKMIRTQDIRYLDPISDGDCWSWFRKQAFDNSHALESSEFERIGGKIMQKCKGIPLAVKTVIGLLRCTEVEEWDDILRSDLWNLDDKPNDILPILRLSYHRLPPHLKHCFAFCAVFPKNYTFGEEELVLLWMANDLLQLPNRDDKTIGCMEDVGRKYFSQLRSRSFFHKKSEGGYLMHDLINDLARFVSGKFCVRLEDHQSHEISREVRHVSFMHEDEAFERFKFLSQAKRLRTFFPSGSEEYFSRSALIEKFLSDMLPQLGRLRVLSLRNYLHLEELSNSLGNLKHLRYVNFSNTSIRQLPNAICDLYNLQTLMLSYCDRLNELPKDITKLVNLHHLDVRGTNLRNMPSNMSRLKSLQTLSCFVVDNSPGRRIEELGKLSLCGYLKINGLQNVTSCNDALKACLSNKNHLEDLVLQWNGTTNDSRIGKDILDKLQPHTNLKSLIVDGYGGTSFPDWLANCSFCNIVSLHLRECKNCFMLPTLGHLVSLKSLAILGLHSITRIGEEFYGNGSLIRPFASLMTLVIEEMSQLEEWDTPPYTDFSCLEELIIRKCPNLKGKLPPRLSSLRKFEISGCEQLECFNEWAGIVQDNQGDSLSHHLFSLKILSISDLPNLKELPKGLHRLELEYLKIETCNGLVSFPKVMARANTMYLENCSSLMSLPIMAPVTWIRNCPNLEFSQGENSDDSYSAVKDLLIDGCKSLEVFPSLQNLTLLRELRILDCNDFLSFPKGGLPAPNLELLHLIGCKKLKSLPEQMHSVHPSLRQLMIRSCPEIESFPKEGLPSRVEFLSISDCEKLVRNPIRDWGLHRLPALRLFEIFKFNEESFPDEGLLPCTLTELNFGGRNLKTLNAKGFRSLTFLRSLWIWGCPNLQSLPKEDLPTSLKSLESLTIWDCPNLQSLQEKGLPTSLSRLDVEDCPKLKPHLEREKGKYWPIISHIPDILVDRECIS